MNQNSDQFLIINSGSAMATSKMKQVKTPLSRDVFSSYSFYNVNTNAYFWQHVILIERGIGIINMYAVYFSDDAIFKIMNANICIIVKHKYW